MSEQLTAQRAEPEPPVTPTRFRRLKVRRLKGRTWFIILTSAVIIYLVIGPLAMLVFSTFRRTDGTLPFERASTWSLENYQSVFLSSETYSVLWATFIFTAGSLVLSFTISIALSWLIERTDLPLRNTFYTLVIASLGIPGVVAGISWTLLLSPRAGVINQVLRSTFGLTGEGPINIFSMTGMIAIQGITMVPITFLLITAAFRAMNAVLEEAGFVSGAPFRTVVRRITLPVLTPGLISAGIYQLVNVIESFDVPLLIGLPAGIRVLSTRIFVDIRPPTGLPDFGRASTYSMLLLAFSLGPLLYYNYVMARSERFSTVSGRDYRPRRYELGRGKAFALVGVSFFLVVSFMLPVAVLLWISLQPYIAAPSVSALGRVTVDAYAALSNDFVFTKALRNTLVLGGATAIAAMMLGSFAAWIVVRYRTWASRLLDVLTFVPHAFPGVIVAMTVMLIYLLLPIPIFGTIWIIVVALATEGLTLSSRLMSGGIAQISKELEEAAEVSGAQWRQVLRRILFPLVSPPFVNGLLLIFLLSIKRLTAPLILQSPDSVVLSTLIFTRWDAGQTSSTAAIGVVTVAMTVVLSVLLRRFGSVGTV